jgi:hypothetical protein
MTVRHTWNVTPNGRFQQCRIDELGGPLGEALAWLVMQSADRRAFVVVECIEVHLNDETGKRWTVERFVQFCGLKETSWMLFDMPTGQLSPAELSRVGPELGDRVESRLVPEEGSTEEPWPLVTIQRLTNDRAEGVRLALRALEQVMGFPAERVVTVSMQETHAGGQN